jgi:hypothetical protein
MKSQNLLPQGSQRISTKNTSYCFSNIYICELCAFFVFFVVKNTFRSGLFYLILFTTSINKNMSIKKFNFAEIQ